MPYTRENSTRFMIVMLYITILQTFCYLTANTSVKVLNKKLFLMPAKDENSSLSPAFLQYLVEIFEIDTLVESGTYSGGTLKNALPYFKNLYSIELSLKLYHHALRLFPERNIHLYHGNSPQVLLKILPHIEGRFLFWLDGHYSGGGTAKSDKNTPIIEELEAIKKCNLTDAVILIDDLRCFRQFDQFIDGGALFGYPTIIALQNAIKEINPNYEFVVYGDIGLAFLPHPLITISPVIQACTISRFALENNNIALNDIQHAEAIIAHATGQEKFALENLYTMLAKHDPYNLANLYRHWVNLTTNVTHN